MKVVRFSLGTRVIFEQLSAMLFVHVNVFDYVLPLPPHDVSLDIVGSEADADAPACANGVATATAGTTAGLPPHAVGADEHDTPCRVKFCRCLWSPGAQ